MCEGKGSEDDDIWADVERMSRIQVKEVVAVTCLIPRCKGIPPGGRKPVRQRIQHTRRKGYNLFRQFCAVQETLDYRWMGPVGGDVEWDKVGEVDSIYYT